MSIIYDALKKVEHMQNDNSQIKADIKTKKKPNPAFRVYLVYILVLCLGAWIMDGVFSLYNKSLKPAGLLQLKAKAPMVKEDIYGYAPVSPAVVKAASAVAVARAGFSLNGIFFSEDEGFALINNQIVKEGDAIEGAKILRISANEVELDLDGSVFKLSSGS